MARQGMLRQCSAFCLPSTISVTVLMSVIRLTTPTTFRPYDVRQSVSLHVIAHMSFERGYQRTLDSTLSRAQFSRKREYSFAFRHFHPKANVIRLSDDNPGEILRRFCDGIFNETSTTILHIINPFKHFRSESAQFVSNLIHHVGLPVITWGPEYEAASSKVNACV